MDKLEELLTSQHLIPAGLRDRYILFKETFFTGPCGNQCVEGIWFDVIERRWQQSAMDIEWCGRIPKALRLNTIAELDSL